MFCFVTPAWGRFELSRICFAQHAQALGQLRSQGYQAMEVVVADDENLEIAREFGLETLECANDGGFWGRRLNEGYEFARDAGALWIGPMDSDCWFLPERATAMAHIASNGAVASSRRLTVFREDGRHRLDIEQNYGHPFLLLMPSSSLEAVSYRPVQEGVEGNESTSTLARLRDSGASFATIPGVPFELVGFTLPEKNATEYDYWLDQYGGVVTTDTYEGSVFAPLRECYPGWLVDGVEGLYAH